MKCSLIKFLKNIKYLFSNDIRTLKRDVIYDTMACVEDYCKYELNDSNKVYGLNILNYEDTIDLLLKEPKSFCRFGDGEIEIIQGKSIPFQKYDKILAEEMLYILQNDIPNLYVGINYNYFNAIDNLNDTNKQFYLVNVTPYRRFIAEICNKQRTYIAAAFNQLYMFLRDYNYSAYYKKIQEMFKGRDLIIFAGEGALERFKYDVFESAKTKHIVPCPNKNSFDNYEMLMKKAKGFSKDQTICLMIGPTSKVMTYHLSQLGYMAWDLGHMAKDFNAYMLNISKSENEIIKFNSPEK